MLNFLNFAFFVSLNKVFSNFVSGERKRVCVCFVRAKDRMRCYLKSRFEILFCKIIGSSLFIQFAEERQSKDFFYFLRCSEAREGTWDSIIAVIGDGAKSELAGVRKFSLLPL